jgi:polyphosphate kinase 2 (PPK2 family)
VSPQVQAARLGARAADPWLRWTMRPDEAGGAAERASTEALWEQLLARTATRWAGWTIVEGREERSAGLAALEAIARGLEKVVPAEPPVANEKIVALGGAKRHW